MQSSIEILELIAEKPLTFDEIADETDMNQNTITQKLNALIDGVYSGLTLTESTAFLWTGRYRKLARHNKKRLVEQFIGLLESDGCILFCGTDGTLTGTLSGATFKSNPRGVLVLPGV